MKKKNGFTLVELLAVIVILAIILAIAVPSISTMVSNSRRSAFEANVKMVIKGIDYKILENATITVSDTTDQTASIGDYGANPADYTSFLITSTSPVTISLTGASTGKFGTCAATGATMSSVTVSGC